MDGLAHALDSLTQQIAEKHDFTASGAHPGNATERHVEVVYCARIRKRKDVEFVEAEKKLREVRMLRGVNDVQEFGEIVAAQSTKRVIETITGFVKVLRNSSENLSMNAAMSRVMYKVVESDF